MRCERMSLEKFETWSANQTRVADQKPLACSAFLSSRGGRVGALWTMSVDQSKAGRCRGGDCGRVGCSRFWRLAPHLPDGTVICDAAVASRNDTQQWRGISRWPNQG